MDYWMEGSNSGSDEDTTQDQTSPIAAPPEKTLGEWLYPNMKQSFMRDQPDEGGGDGSAPGAGDSGGDFWKGLGDFFGPDEAEAKGNKSANYNPYPADASEAERLDHLPRVLYKETAGMRPQSVDPTAGPDNRDKWDPASFEDLQNGRKHMVVVAMRNPGVGYFEGNDFDPKVWNDCQAAAKEGMGLEEYMPEEVQHFYMAKEGVPVKETVDWAQDDSIYDTFGPFKSWGGDIKNGENAIIRIHEKKYGEGAKE